MKKIGIDARLLGQTGVGRYIKNLLYYLKDNRDFLFYLYVPSRMMNELNYLPKNVILKESNYKWHSISEQTRFLGRLLQDQLDLMHFTYFSYPLFYRKPFIITLHDLTPYFFKTGKASTHGYLTYAFKHFFYRMLVKNAVFNAHAVITPSKSVKNEIIKTFGQRVSNKIYPIYEGVDYDLAHAKENTSLTARFKRPFFLYVGNFYPHKNVEMLIEVFSHLKEHELVLLGKRDFFARRIEEQVKKTSSNTIHFFFDATDEDLVFFYKNAQALINPSLSEGFGLPLIEALYFGCPVIASDIPVFNEILNGNFMKFNPHDQNDIQNKILKQLKETKKPDYNGILQQFSFKKMAEETLSLYKKTVVY